MKKNKNQFIVISIMFFFMNSVFSQELIFVRDSIMSNYMENGYSNEHFMPKGKMKNNQRIGKWKDYEVSNDFEYVSINGEPKQLFGYFLLYGEGEYIEGKRSGVWKFYVLEDISFKKMLQKEVNYQKGIKNGSFKYFFPNGKIGVEGEYLNDEYEGIVSSYYVNNNVYGKRDYHKGLRVNKHSYFYENGNIKIEQNFTNDTLNGVFKGYYKSGNIQEILNLKMGLKDGVYKYYYANGQLWIEKEYKNDLFINVICSYDKNGLSKNKGTLQNGDGTVNFYTEEGIIYLTQIYSDGKLISEEKK